MAGDALLKQLIGDKKQLKKSTFLRSETKTHYQPQCKFGINKQMPRKVWLRKRIDGLVTSKVEHSSFLMRVGRNVMALAKVEGSKYIVIKASSGADTAMRSNSEETAIQRRFTWE